ncbi:MAG: hypothetical protein QM673_04530 [Gordonia sp. (in: high G+C Gram-positive bacteria)]
MSTKGVVMVLSTGQSLASTVDATTVIVVRAPDHEVSITCGGAPMVDGRKGSGDGGSIAPEHRDPTLLGKRYVDDDAGLELLCTKPGAGALAANGSTLVIKSAKPLPASD